MSERTRRRTRSRSRTNNTNTPSNNHPYSSSKNRSSIPRLRNNNRSSKPPRPTNQLPLKRSKSEPILFTNFDFTDRPGIPDESCTVLYRPQTCLDIFASQSFHHSPTSNLERFDGDAKVVVSVTVEGSPGPVRALVRLGASVEETIGTVVNKYGEEGRRPLLPGVEELSAFDLHHSHFSLQSINKNVKIGEVGSRSFYLRRNNSSRSSNSGKEDLRPSTLTVDVENSVVLSPFMLISAFLARKFNKIGRRTKKLWKVMGCLTCGS
ncbi:hypothetical protein Syun_013096 [Stephania yunnanensis]|uniref:DUF7054 domain-containing protein n=1 Tax=Stephania yunnanensis TaxID=152371 RepID=A0AAP0PK27_9MAGN